MAARLLQKKRLQLPGCNETDGVQCACAEQTVARMIWVFVWNVRGPQPNVLASFSNVEMATNANISEPSDSEQSSLNDHNLSNRSSNKSLRVAEKERRRKNEAEERFTLALKYFSDGKIQKYPAYYLASSVW